MQKILITALLSIAALPIAAQEANSISPYTRYGVGTLLQPASSFSRTLEGTGLGFHDGSQLNVLNPASYAHTDSLTFLFDAGMSVQHGTISTTNDRQSANKATFDYLNLGFRLRKNLGVAVGVQPFSTVGYTLSTQGSPISNGTLGTLTPTYTYQGSGGLTRVFGGVGFAPFRQLSLGANLSYLWGNINHSSTSSFGSTTVNSLRRTYATEIRSFMFDAGLQFSQHIARKHELTLALTYGLGHQLSGRSHFYNQTLSGTSLVSADTLTLSRAFALPHSFGAGLAWKWDNSLRLGVDYQLQRWSQASIPRYVASTGNFVADRSQLTDRHRVSLGAEYVVNPMGYNWSQRVRYRLGLSYATPYQLIDGNKAPNTYAASVGVGLPLFTKYNNRSFINIGLHYEELPAPTANMVKERYLRLSLGITFNDRWFSKWRID